MRDANNIHWFVVWYSDKLAETKRQEKELKDALKADKEQKKHQKDEVTEQFAGLQGAAQCDNPTLRRPSTRSKWLTNLSVFSMALANELQKMLGRCVTACCMARSLMCSARSL
jgi:hypothetical protein